MNQSNSSSRLVSKFLVLLSCNTITAIATTAIAIEPNVKPSASSRIFNVKGEEVGTATFTQTSAGVKVTLQVQKLNPGEHMVHLHENGKCDAPDFKTSGNHFDPKVNSKVDPKKSDAQRNEINHHHKHEASKTENVHSETAHTENAHRNSSHKPAGDLPNILVKQDGTGTLTATLPTLTLGMGRNSLLKQGGTSILIHAGANGKSTIPNVDYKTRIACGIIKPQP